MGKYYIRYLIFLLPAVIVSVLFNNVTAISDMFAGRAFPDILQWFFAFFMILGYGITTYTAAYRFPRATLSFILCYTGINLLIITLLYVTQYGTPLKFFLNNFAGVLSYIPLSILVDALLDFSIPQEVYVTLTLTASCTIGYICGIVRRHVHPYPYRPKIG